MKLSPMRNYILLATLGLSLAASAQTINFETTDYKSLGVYDTWKLHLSAQASLRETML